ncbi:class I SAM-dependent methyltransferase [Yoonia litorea]|uniref:Methyltransferase domain-containing protein n=1 Tax=Yoonia litorea TaxID=1123755 RepID=A0A1I6MDS9_9RHOB|nr:methyltransferase domain-containing protein [Yoonia litorea]SFS13869.1 Methyltransferase domain-containing protein [Yoonia litorea]
MITTEHMDRAILPDQRLLRAYDRLAPTYAFRHQRWLRFAGGEAQAALEAAVRMVLASGSTILDAGAGTGQFARSLLSEGFPPEQITLLDPSRAMLEYCDDIPVTKTLGRIEEMPFANRSFDVVTCAWALEVVTQPDLALSELCRVLKIGGVLCLTFCAQAPLRDLVDWAMRSAVKLRGTGNFLQTFDVIAALQETMPCEVQIMPCSGPAATIIARRLAA